ncbi:hypothetical protein KDU71_17180 [Carboxylicivirga sediminis]|uniref:Endonuclease/exonuclease/phosphatase domain-containing protein n=1 Tax=Carboxylicivirga sediminis TaxID=2006564 RepID=A0A941F900_9BACT|nr:endonuclease/exonuclease/phosphatase family protein [Carboxylicivirga sediminis]MBR8537305.1 hypothetical protein [Carboxylicivirga sediminis]
MCQTITLILLLSTCPLLSQSNNDNSYSVLFYNVENLFDCKNDSLKNDEEFLYNGDKRWSHNRMYKKLTDVSKTILASNGWNAPALIGLCEIENEWVIKQLIYNTGLSSLKYNYIHFECDDHRGIDVALLFKREVFTPLLSAPIKLSEPGSEFFTRDALYVKGVIATDTIHLVINHWPSKRGGSLQSTHKRTRVAQGITAHIDSIKQIETNPKLMIIGDFNAEYTSDVLQSFITKNDIESQLKPNDISNHRIGGSYKYQGQWSLIDHIFLSKNWLENRNYNISHRIVSLPFLLEDDLTFSGVKPYRTYVGPRYNGGVSDHLPVLLNIKRLPPPNH